MFYNPPYQQRYGHLPQPHHLYHQQFSAPPPPANQNQNSGTPWQGFEREALNGPYHPFSRKRYSQPLPQVDTFPYSHRPFPINDTRDPSRFEVPTRQPDPDNLYEDDVHLDYMDFDLGEPNRLPHPNTNIGTQPEAERPQAKHTTHKDTSSAKSPASLKRPSASDGAAFSITSKPPSIKQGQQPIDRVMVLQRRPDAPCLSNEGPSTTPNNSRLYNRQLDFTPSLLSQPPAEYVLDVTFWKIEARDVARRTDATHVKRTSTDDPKTLSVPPVASNQRLGGIREKGRQANNRSQKTPRPPHTGLRQLPQPTTAEKRPSKSVTTAVGSCITVKATSEKASCSERNLAYAPHSHEPSTRTGESFPASYSDNAFPGGDATLDDVKVIGGPRVLGREVYESEKWGGGRLIKSGLKVARLKDEGVDLNSSKPTNVSPAATKSPANSGALRCRLRPGAKGQWKGYVLAESCPPTSNGKLLLLDAPPALLPQGSTRSGKVFKPTGGGSNSEQSGSDDSEEERRVNRSRRSRGVARRRVLLSEDSDE